MYTRQGNKLHHGNEQPVKKKTRSVSDREWKQDARRQGFGGKDGRKSAGRRLAERIDSLERDEKRERPGKKSFGDRKQSNDRKDFRDKDQYRPRPYNGERFQENFSHEVETSENPLAARRNPLALSMLKGKAPSLPATEGPLMRPRRGWKKKTDSDNKN